MSNNQTQSSSSSDEENQYMSRLRPRARIVRNCPERRAAAPAASVPAPGPRTKMSSARYFRGAPRLNRALLHRSQPLQVPSTTTNDSSISTLDLSVNPVVADAELNNLIANMSAFNIEVADAEEAPPTPPAAAAAPVQPGARGRPPAKLPLATKRKFNAAYREWEKIGRPYPSYRIVRNIMDKVKLHRDKDRHFPRLEYNLRTMYGIPRKAGDAAREARNQRPANPESPAGVNEDDYDDAGGAGPSGENQKPAQTEESLDSESD